MSSKQSEYSGDLSLGNSSTRGCYSYFGKVPHANFVSQKLIYSISFASEYYKVPKSLEALV